MIKKHELPEGVRSDEKLFNENMKKLTNGTASTLEYINFTMLLGGFCFTFLKVTGIMA